MRVALLTAALLALASTARAQPFETDVETLATCLVSEAGPVLVADHPAILAVLQRRAERVGRTAAEVALRYCSVFSGRAGEHGRRVRRMRLMQLAEYAPLVVELVAAFWRGEPIPLTCAGEPDHWGARHGRDYERATRAGWRRVLCPGARNAFWSSTRSER